MLNSGGARRDRRPGLSAPRPVHAAAAVFFWLGLLGAWPGRPAGEWAAPGGVARAAEVGGISSGGGSRTNGTERLTDAVGAVAGGLTAGGGLELRSGLLPEVTGITPVTLLAFAATRDDGTGAPRLAWTLSADSDPSGFLVYRAPAADGPWRRITERPLPADARSWLDATAPAEGAAWYRLAALSREGLEVLWGVAVPAPERPGLPAALGLPPNFPNPFRAATTLTVELPVTTAVRLVIFDVSGRVVATLFDGTLEAGRHGLVWDGRTEEGPAAAGVYFGRLEALGQVRTRKLLVAH